MKTDRGGRGLEQQMEVVGHEAVRVEHQPVPGSIRRQAREIGVVVARPKEYGLATITAGNDVVEETRSEQSRFAGHGRISIARARGCMLEEQDSENRRPDPCMAGK